MAKRTRITIETDSLLVLRARKSLRAWCPQCAAEAEMIPLSDVGVVSNLPPAEVQAWMESPDLHHTKAADGNDLICLNSMLKRVRRTREGERLSADLLPQRENINKRKGETMKLSKTAKALTIVAVFALALTAAPAAKAAEAARMPP